MRTFALAFSTAVLALSGAASAQTAPAQRAAHAPMADMTRAQAQARAESMFAKFDANQDGTLNDADRAAMQAKMFDRLDSNKDGAISRAEFTAGHAGRGEARGGHQEGQAGHAMAGKRLGGHHGMMKADGPVTRQAFVAKALNMFDRADADHNGTVTPAERKAARETMRGQWQDRGAARQQG